MKNFCGCSWGKKEKPSTILRLDSQHRSIKKDLGLGGTVPDGKDLFEEHIPTDARPINWKIAENKLSNNTDCYDQTELVVRRASHFSIQGHFTRELNEAGDTLGFELKTGNKPNIKAGTLVRIEAKFEEKINEDSWSATSSVAGEDVDLKVNVPPNAAIGKYQIRLYLRTVTVEGEIATSYTKNVTIFIVANPFSSRDQCFYDVKTCGIFTNNEDFLDEYVLNENGAIWRGSQANNGPKQWIFGQFESPVLEVACYLLANDKRTNSAKGGAKLADIVQVVRILSSGANSCDNNGVLAGNWSGVYTGGISPVTWQSSVSIIKQFMDSGYQPVKYGQCWVFSGVLTALLRAVGIPARSVTNFQSAHDSDNTMTIDTYINDKGEELKNSDSVWNFHVWNECWLNRRDLPEGYSGWQAVDATPQEESNDISQCGPAPVKAIKNGETFVNFDSNFIFAEVNADRCIWLCDETPTGIIPKELTSRTTHGIGKFISTKAPGKTNFAREDVTQHYKYPEGTKEERASFANAFSFTGLRKERSFMQEHLLGVKKMDIDIEIGLKDPTEGAKMGKDIELDVSIKNRKTGEVLEITEEPIITLNSTYQVGGVSGTIAKEQIPAKTISDSVQHFPVTVSHELYKDRLASDGQGFVRATLLAKVKNSDGVVETHSALFNFSIEIPKYMIDINMSHVKCRLKDPDVAANIVFTNRLPYVLSDIKITMDARGLFTTKTSSIPSVSPKQRLEFNVKIDAEKVGVYTIMVNVDSAEVKDIEAFVTLEIVEK